MTVETILLTIIITKRYLKPILLKIFMLQIAIFIEMVMVVHKIEMLIDLVGYLDLTMVQDLQTLLLITVSLDILNIILKIMIIYLLIQISQQILQNIHNIKRNHMFV